MELDKEKYNHTLLIFTGAVLLVLNPIQWFLGEFISAHAWKNPPYSFTHNFISDLGASTCTVTTVLSHACSPLYFVMNSTFVLFGLIFCLATLFLSQVYRKKYRYVFIILSVLYALGMLGVGLVQSTQASVLHGTIIIHKGGAFVALLIGNVTSLLVGYFGFSIPSSVWYRRGSMWLGSIGILALLGIVQHSSIPQAIFERISAYTFIVWMFVTGLTLLHNRKMFSEK